MSKTLFGVFKDFLRHLLREAKRDAEVTEEKLIEYTDTMVNTLLAPVPIFCNNFFFDLEIISCIKNISSVRSGFDLIKNFSIQV